MLREAGKFGAALRWHPEVRGTGIEDHCEVHSRGSDFDRSIVLRILDVGDRNLAVEIVNHLLLVGGGEAQVLSQVEIWLLDLYFSEAQRAGAKCEQKNLFHFIKTLDLLF